jgi:hypothetical protein
MDQETEKYREVDLQAITGAGRAGEASLWLWLSIECKSTKSPWVGLVSRRDPSDRSFVASAPGIMTRRFALAAQALGIPLPRLLPAETVRAESVISGFALDKEEDQSVRRGKAQVKTDHDPTSPYAALQQVVNAAKHYDLSLFRNAIEAREQLKTATMVLPVVLLKGPLFAYSVAADLQETIEAVDCLLVSVPTDNEDNSTLVAVITEEFGKDNWDGMRSQSKDFCKNGLNFAGRIANALTMNDRDIVEKA